jgi:recombination-promoting nuclease RpnB
LILTLIHIIYHILFAVFFENTKCTVVQIIIKEITLTTIPTPHDRFFRCALSDPQVAKAFFEFHLPPAIRAIVDLDSLQLYKGSFVTEQLKLAITDMLFKVNFIDKPSYLYLLVEHQSSSDRWMPFRALKYDVNIMEHDLKKTDNKSLPIVYNIVFYHGKVPYAYSTSLLDLFGAPELAQISLQPLHLIDVSCIPNAQLNQNAWLSVLLLCTKYIFASDILPYLPEILQPLRVVEQAGDYSYVKAALIYLVNAGEVSNQQAFVEIILKGLSTETGENMMTIAQQFKEQGRVEGEAIGIERGIEKGKTEAKKIIAMRILNKGLSLATISQITDLSIEELQTLEEESVH